MPNKRMPVKANAKITQINTKIPVIQFQTRLNVCDDVYSIIKQEKKTALLVSHDISECISLCDKIIVLSKRPAHIVKTINIGIDKMLSPLKRRENPLLFRIVKPKYVERDYLIHIVRRLSALCVTDWK